MRSRVPIVTVEVAIHPEQAKLAITEDSRKVDRRHTHHGPTGHHDLVGVVLPDPLDNVHPVGVVPGDHVEAVQ